jgi:RNA polymerase sigma-54 factor
MAAYLLTHLDEDGLITIKLIEVAAYFHIPLARVEAVQRIIQRSDPLGVGSSSPKDAMLVQLENLKDTCCLPDLARQILENGMELLSRRQFVELARRLKAPIEKVRDAAHFISENLNPFPGRSYWGDVRQPNTTQNSVYYKPDIVISQLAENHGGTLVVEILFPLWGTLRVNPLYRQVIQQANEDQKDSMRGDLDRASLFVKCLQQRNHTMQRLLQNIASLQREFILRGEKYLKPITRAYLSKELGVHESTISRAVANKAVQMPNGRIIPLADFFDRSLSARVALKELISGESRPLSDSELVHLMSERGFEVARRTVAKYRAMEGILPASLRRPCT